MKYIGVIEILISENEFKEADDKIEHIVHVRDILGNSYLSEYII